MKMAVVAKKCYYSKISLIILFYFYSSEVMERKDGHQMVFKAKKSRKQLEQEEKDKQHRKERLGVRRSASSIKKDRIKPKFWNGKRII